MKFIRDLFGGRRRNAAAQSSNDAESLEQSYRDAIGSIVDENQALQRGAAGQDVAVSDMLTNVNSKLNASEAAPAPTPSVNIWDMDGDGLSSELPQTAPELPQAVAASAAARSPSRARRTKTRLIGFDKSDGDVVDIFNDANEPSAAPVVKRAKFPVGWIVVAEGPGRGESFALFAGMSQIGRGEDQAVQLDFGDNSISRTNHAAIVFDSETQEFLLGHGGKSNIVRLNDKPLISNEKLATGDTIRIGETVLKFVALCDENFNWSEGGETEEDDDVAIA